MKQTNYRERNNVYTCSALEKKWEQITTNIAHYFLVQKNIFYIFCKPLSLSNDVFPGLKLKWNYVCKLKVDRKRVLSGSLFNNSKHLFFFTLCNGLGVEVSTLLPLVPLYHRVVIAFFVPWASWKITVVFLLR